MSTDIVRNYFEINNSKVGRLPLYIPLAITSVDGEQYVKTDYFRSYSFAGKRKWFTWTKRMIEYCDLFEEYSHFQLQQVSVYRDALFILIKRHISHEGKIDLEDLYQKIDDITLFSGAINRALLTPPKIKELKECWGVFKNVSLNEFWDDIWVHAESINGEELIYRKVKDIDENKYDYNL